MTEPFSYSSKYVSKVNVGLCWAIWGIFIGSTLGYLGPKMCLRTYAGLVGARRFDDQISCPGKAWSNGKRHGVGLLRCLPAHFLFGGGIGR